MDAGYLAVHMEEDRRHWWFRGRLRILLAVLERALPAKRPLRLLELGCGTGNVLAALRRYGEAIGMEPSDALAEAGRARGLDVRRGALPGDLVVPPGWADAVLLLDVIEHVEDDGGALRTAHTALHDGGLLVVMVPAHRWLWSGHDVLLGHRRRYSAPGLRGVVEEAGFRVERLTYFNTILFSPVVVLRLWQRLRKGRAHSLRRTPRFVNRCLEALFASERHIVARYALPLGASLLLLARR